MKRTSLVLLVLVCIVALLSTRCVNAAEGQGDDPDTPRSKSDSPKDIEGKSEADTRANRAREALRLFQSKLVKPKTDETDKGDDEDEDEDDVACAACQDTSEGSTETVETKCKHRFHQRCIDKWLQTHSTCPACRFDLRELTDAEKQSRAREEALNAVGMTETGERSLMQEYRDLVGQYFRENQDLARRPFLELRQVPVSPAFPSLYRMSNVLSQQLRDTMDTLFTEGYTDAARNLQILTAKKYSLVDTETALAVLRGQQAMPTVDSFEEYMFGMESYFEIHRNKAKQPYVDDLGRITGDVQVTMLQLWEMGEGHKNATRNLDIVTSRGTSIVDAGTVAAVLSGKEPMPTEDKSVAYKQAIDQYFKDQPSKIRPPFVPGRSRTVHSDILLAMNQLYEMGYTDAVQNMDILTSESIQALFQSDFTIDYELLLGVAMSALTGGK